MSVSAATSYAAVSSVPVLLRARPAAALDTPTELIDGFGRVHSDLRLSVTDRCNLRCTYCMPEEGMDHQPRAELLTFDEIVRVAKVAHSLGVRSVRITGGEPLVRRDLPTLIRRLASVGFDDLALTTNGMRLARCAKDLVDAGLMRCNVSCDSLDTALFSSIRRGGDLSVVLAAMDAAESSGLPPVKVNVVLIRGVNDHEVEGFAAFGRKTGRTVRFIEFMPLDADGQWKRSAVVPGEEITARINALWPLQPVDPPDVRDPAPATLFRFVDGGGEIGVVATVTQPFCATCDRLRLAADGSVHNCLFSNDGYSVRDVIRSGGTDEAIAAVFRRAVAAKRAGLGTDDVSLVRPAHSMSMIGG
jgi:GTP 3',8-cyclase